MFTNRANQDKWVIRFDQKPWEESFEIFTKKDQAIHWGKMVIEEDYKRPTLQQQFKDHTCFEIGQIDFNDPCYDYHITNCEIIAVIDINNYKSAPELNYPGWNYPEWNSPEKHCKLKESHMTELESMDENIKELALNPFKDGIPTIKYESSNTGKLYYKGKLIGKVLNSSKLNTDGIKDIKQCVMCDTVLGDQNTPYTINHYLCSEYCTCNYMDMVIWQIHSFKIHLPKLNSFRRLCGLRNLTSEEVDKRIDLPGIEQIEFNTCRMENINVLTKEGKYLLAAISILTNDIVTIKTPNEVFETLDSIVKDMFKTNIADK